MVQAGVIELIIGDHSDMLFKVTEIEKYTWIIKRSINWYPSPWNISI